MNIVAGIDEAGYAPTFGPLVLSVSAFRVEKGQDIPKDFFPRAVDFIRNFADRTHHGKEEDNLFPALEQHGMPRQGGPVGVMLDEHDQGRGLVSTLKARAELGWEPTVSFEQLVHLLVDSELERLRLGPTVERELRT